MKHTVRGILVILMIISLCGCKKEDEKVTLGNAECITYDYLYKLAKGEMTKEKVYTYDLDKIFVCYECNPEDFLGRYDVSIKDEEIQEKVNRIVEKYTITEKITEGKVEKGDTVNLDILAYDGEKELSEQALKNYEYTLGGNLLEELDEKLVDLAIGEVFDMPAHFEENYENAEFAGKDILFTIKVNYVIKKDIPEVDDELIKKYAKSVGETEKYSSLSEYKVWVEESLKADKVSEARGKIFEEMWALISKKSEIKEMPQWDYDTAYNQVLDTMKERYEENKDKYSSYDEFLAQYNYNEASIQEFAKESAQKYVTEKLIVLSIAKKNKITVSKDEYEECISEYMKEYNYGDKEAFYKGLGNSRNIFILERYYELLYKKVVDNIYSEIPTLE